MDEHRRINEEFDREEAIFASNLKRLMEKADVFADELADAIGVSTRTINLMLLRRCRPQQATVAKIAKVFGVPREELWPKRYSPNTLSSGE